MAQRPHILIAEDDQEDRFLMSETFNELGYIDTMELVEDGIKLIEYLDTAGADAVKLIVLDLNMPRLNGTETLRILKDDDRYQQIPVVIFSTSINHTEMDVCMKLGAKEYITKPCNYSEYIAICHKFYGMIGGLA